MPRIFSARYQRRFFFTDWSRFKPRSKVSTQGVFIRRRCYGINESRLHGREETIENADDNNGKRQQRRWQPWRWVSPHDVGSPSSSSTSRIRSSAQMRDPHDYSYSRPLSRSLHPCFLLRHIAFIHSSTISFCADDFSFSLGCSTIVRDILRYVRRGSRHNIGCLHHKKLQRL